MPEDESHFDDPQLKAALQRAVPMQGAPATLRSRIEATVAKRERLIFGYRIWSLAAAAVLVLAVGLISWQVEREHANSGQDFARAQLPETFAANLVATHDGCSRLPDHHILKGVPDDDFRMMTQKLREQLGFPALAAAAGNGWKFCGASSLCKVGTARSAHLLFKQNDESLSIFSLPVAAETWPAGSPTDGEKFATMQANHPILSWVKEGTVYSVVAADAKGSLHFADIETIADKLRDSPVTQAPAARVTLALQ